MKIIKSNLRVLKINILILFLLVYILSFNIEMQKSSIIVSSSLVKKVYPIGRCIGLKLYTKGVLVVGMSEIKDKNGNSIKPYESSGIEIGDIIKKVNGNEINKSADVENIVNNSKNDEIEIEYYHDDEEKTYTTKVKRVLSDENVYLLGLWVRDAASGIGTITFYDKDNNSFAALGHGINDIDTDKLLQIKNGEIVNANIVSVVKANEKNVGEIRGTIDNENVIGTIEKNTEFGIYGIANKNLADEANKNKYGEIEVAKRNEIKIGKATIICELKNDDIEEYEIEIQKIFKNDYKDNKNMLIKVTDKKLLEETGGIIPGMSGTPIIQNGKLIGAITNVLVNNPQEGYAICADMMVI